MTHPSRPPAPPLTAVPLHPSSGAEPAPVPPADLSPESLAHRRRAALLDARDEVAGATGGGPVAVTRRFGDGCVVVALGGEVDLVATERVEAMLRELRRAAVTELVLDLGAVTAHHPRLSRVIGRARIRCVTDDVRVELHHLPPTMREALAAGGADEGT